MRPVKIKDMNADFAKPRDWDEATMGPCGSLPIRREVIGTPGNGAFISHKSNWKPSARELETLNAGGVVELECCGIQPAVSIGVVRCDDPDANKPATEVCDACGGTAVCADKQCGLYWARERARKGHAAHCGYPEQGCICRANETSPLG